MSRCTLPELREMMKRARIEATTRPCPEHGRHIVENGTLELDRK